MIEYLERFGTPDRSYPRQRRTVFRSRELRDVQRWKIPPPLVPAGPRFFLAGGGPGGGAGWLGECLMSWYVAGDTPDPPSMPLTQSILSTPELGSQKDWGDTEAVTTGLTALTD